MEVTGRGLAKHLATLIPHLDTDNMTIGGKANLRLVDIDELQIEASISTHQN